MASATSTPAASTGRSTRSTARRSTTARASPSSTSPTRLSRIQEKDELRHLNDRLANYIERVRKLENDKSSMVLLLEEKEEAKMLEMGNVRRLYEAELADARKTLDELASEKARLQIDYGRLSEDHRKLQTRSQKKEADLTNALAQWRSLEAALNSKDAEYTNLFAEKSRLESDVTDLQAQLAHLEAVVADTRSQLNGETLRRVDMENQMQTLKEQLDFQRSISEQEIHEMRSRHESRLVEVDSGRQRVFDSKLAEAMQQLRQEHEAQIQQYKEELERTFSAKLYVRQIMYRTVLEREAVRVLLVSGEERGAEETMEVKGEQGPEMRAEKEEQFRECSVLLIKLDNAQQTAVKNSDVALLRGEELAGTKLRIETLSAHITQFQKENGLLESRVRELERTLDREREVWQQRLSQKEQEMLNMRTKMLSQLEDYENLLDVKLALDMEINAYRKMLEGEEQRLHLSPSPSQHATVSRTHGHGIHRPRGKKRKHEGASGSSPAYKVSQHATAHGPVTVAEVDLEGNYVMLKNSSEVEQPLGRWVVRKTQAGSADISFQIPPSYVLAAGQNLTIWAADAEVEAYEGDLVLQSHRSWGPISDVKVALLNPSHEEMAERRVVCVQGRGPEESELEFDEECMAGSDIEQLGRKPKRRKKKCCSVS